MDFTGKTALVTGASRGIGRAVAVLLAEHGARVAVHYHQNEAAAHATLAAMPTVPGGEHLLVQADLADADAVQHMVETAASGLGRLDVLVNNAGIFEECRIADDDYAAWQAHWSRTLAANLIGAANAAYCAAQVMIPQGGGQIVNVSSRGAFRGEPTAPAYGASKAGMNAMSQSLAVALAPHNILVTTVAPGWVATDMAGHEIDRDDGAAIRAQSPFNRIATPEEIARTVVWLAAGDVPFISGAVVDVNGASYLRT